MNRALLECIADRKFGAPEIAEVLAFFGQDPPACVFCGAVPIARWDHLVPVTKGGDTVLGNMVPTCSKCDDSQRDEDFAEWAAGSAPGSPRSRGIADVDQRIKRIRAYVAKYAYQPRNPTQRLNEQELRQFHVLREDLGKLRKDFDDLIAAFRKRSGLR